MRRQVRFYITLLFEVIQQVPYLFFSFVRFSYRWGIVVVLLGAFGTVFGRVIIDHLAFHLIFIMMFVYALFLPALGHVSIKENS